MNERFKFVSKFTLATAIVSACGPSALDQSNTFEDQHKGDAYKIVIDTPEGTARCYTNSKPELFQSNNMTKLDAKEISCFKLGGTSGYLIMPSID